MVTALSHGLAGVLVGLGLEVGVPMGFRRQGQAFAGVREGRRRPAAWSCARAWRAEAEAIVGAPIGPASRTCMERLRAVSGPAPLYKSFGEKHRDVARASASASPAAAVCPDRQRQAYGLAEAGLLACLLPCSPRSRGRAAMATRITPSGGHRDQAQPEFPGSPSRPTSRCFRPDAWETRNQGKLPRSAT